MSKCSVDGCVNIKRARGYCTKHYERIMTNGTIYTINAEPLRGTLQERFDKSFRKNMVTNCWEWFRTLDKNGYGVLYFDSKALKAHRVSFEIYKESIPGGYLVCHSCDNPCCVNPDHLWIGTQKDNMIDMVTKKRHPLSIKGISRDVPKEFKTKWRKK